MSDKEREEKIREEFEQAYQNQYNRLPTKADIFGRIKYTDAHANGAWRAIGMPTKREAELLERIAELENSLETERIRLAACGVVALSNTAESAISARDMKDEYWSASVQDVAAAVDREMSYRSEIERLKQGEPVAWLEWDGVSVAYSPYPEAKTLPHGKFDLYASPQPSQEKGND